MTTHNPSLPMNKPIKDTGESTPKKRVVFKFDERSFETREEFEATARAEGWKLVEVETTNGTVLIPDFRRMTTPNPCSPDEGEWKR